MIVCGMIGYGFHSFAVVLRCFEGICAETGSMTQTSRICRWKIRMAKIGANHAGMLVRLCACWRENQQQSTESTESTSGATHRPCFLAPQGVLGHKNCPQLKTCWKVLGETLQHAKTKQKENKNQDISASSDRSHHRRPKYWFSDSTDLTLPANLNKVKEQNKHIIIPYHHPHKNVSGGKKHIYRILQL